MKNWWVAIVILLLVAGAALFIFRKVRRSIRQPVPISSITFQQVDGMVRTDPSDAKVKECSQRLQGTRVRWSGKIRGIDEDNTVFVAVNVFPSDVQFQISQDAASSLRKGQTATFVGTIENVSLLDTSPPMLHTYVVLKDVTLE